MHRTDRIKKLDAAHHLLTDADISPATFAHVRELLKGINPTLDSHLETLARTLQQISHIQNKNFEAISEEAIKRLGEDTEEKKKRKKALLLFLTSWKNLKGEVVRVKKELESDFQDHTRSPKSQASMIGRILGKAKGPLGITTFFAAGIAAGLIWLQNNSVAMTITNQGCDPIVPTVRMPLSFPGISLPDEIIPTGGQATAYLPPLTFSVDGTTRDTLRLTALGFSLTFQLDSGIDVSVNGFSLLGKTTTLRLSDRERHDLVIRCT